MEIEEIDFANTLLDLLELFHDFQLENIEPDGRNPYDYNTLGFAEWMRFNYFAPPSLGVNHKRGGEDNA